MGLLKALPATLQFEYNGRHYRLDLFLYVLRHTFWRPREVLVYYAALLALAMDIRRWESTVPVEAVRQCIKATTTKVIESEFIAEFRSTVVNIEDVILAFRKRKPLINYSELSEILRALTFRLASGPLGTEGTFEKARFLYDIGFLGIRADKRIMDLVGLKHEHVFYFNEGSEIWSGFDEADVKEWHFVIHPIFSEYLRLDCAGQELTLVYSWDYLRSGDSFMSSNPEF